RDSVSHGAPVVVAPGRIVLLQASGTFDAAEVYASGTVWPAPADNPVSWRVLSLGVSIHSMTSDGRQFAVTYPVWSVLSDGKETHSGIFENGTVNLLSPDDRRPRLDLFALH